MNRCAHGNTEACFACYPPTEGVHSWFSTDDDGLVLYRPRRRRRGAVRRVPRSLARMIRERSRT